MSSGKGREGCWGCSVPYTEVVSGACAVVWNILVRLAFVNRVPSGVIFSVKKSKAGSVCRQILMNSPPPKLIYLGKWSTDCGTLPLGQSRRHKEPSLEKSRRSLTVAGGFPMVSRSRSDHDLAAFLIICLSVPYSGFLSPLFCHPNYKNIIWSNNHRANLYILSIKCICIYPQMSINLFW